MDRPMLIEVIKEIKAVEDAVVASEPDKALEHTSMVRVHVHQLYDALRSAEKVARTVRKADVRSG
jgi:Mg2+ and Co2+ transporter CorA